ncbi:serine/threonine protein kinase [Actinocorallia herbida]|uniref:non-specific serine/threonine protein kinase n=1 Tax=Actinocorallia herbida TaxID=58109 RepID=A0A3N1DBQ5_9ACTN|nr:protein kinase [Actinocorallia herbida]ROO90957.1 serine/threonine protein kinase [Actinocorallia herbida]
MREGLVLSGRFELRRKIGQGGMGAVWEGLDQTLGRRVAIKTLAVSPTAEAARRLRAEAQIGASLSHPGITVVHDIGEYEQTLYVVMEYLEGHDLAHALKDGGLSRDRALSVARELLGALGAAHAQGVVHRDVKPANVMLLDKGGLKILDFGISRFADSTMTGSVIGTPGYMAPEQFSGSDVDARCDLYSFGVLLYELCTGRLPFDCQTLPEFVTAHLYREPEPPRTLRPELPEALNRLILDLLAKDRDARPSSAEEALARLEAVRFDAPGATFGGPLSAAPPVTPPPQAFTRPSAQAGTQPPANAGTQLPFSFQQPQPQAPQYPQHTQQPPLQQAPFAQSSPPPVLHTPQPFVQPGPPGLPTAPSAQGYGHVPMQHQPMAPAQPAYPQQPWAAGRPQVREPSYLRRAVAFGVDWGLAFFIVVIFVGVMTIGGDPEADLTDPQAAAMLIVWALIYLLYGAMEGVLGYSPGKGLLRLQVVDERTGRTLGAARGVARVFAQILNWWTCFIGYLWPLWDPKKQTFADKICTAKVLTR